MALGAEYDSGLPFQADNTEAFEIAVYGQAVVNQLNWNRGRILPHLTESASIGYDLYQNGERSISLQADCNDVSNRMQVLDFGGLFSGNAIGPARSYTARLTAKF